MKILVNADHHYYQTPDGKVWVKNIYGYAFWQRYLQVFDEVVVFARVNQVKTLDSNDYLLSSGPNVTFWQGVPGFRRAKGFIKNYFLLRRKAIDAVNTCDCVLLRVPNILDNFIYDAALKAKKPIALEVVANPKTFWCGHKLLLGSFIKFYIAYKLQRQCRNANGVAYVTSNALQEEFPCRALMAKDKSQYFTSNYSSVDLNDDAFIPPAQRDWQQKTEFLLSHISLFNTWYKGYKELFMALKALRTQGYNISLVMIGDGPLRADLEIMVREMALETVVQFTGSISDQKNIRECLRKSDIFVFPSYSEGIPRALLEAMACGLPCVATAVGGIPEVLSSDSLVPPRDADALTAKLLDKISNPETLGLNAAENFNVAKQFHRNVLAVRQKDFYSKLRHITVSCACILWQLDILLSIA